MIRSILLATDGSSTAERAAEFAASLARRYHTKVLVLHAYTPGPLCEGDTDHNRRIYESLDEARTLVDQVAGRLGELGAGEVEIDVMEGPAAHVILGVTESRRPDLIVIGARGKSTWQGALLGSVSMAVTQRAECPVLVVK